MCNSMRWVTSLFLALFSQMALAEAPPLPNTTQFIELFFPSPVLAERVRGRLALALVSQVLEVGQPNSFGRVGQGVPGMYSSRDLRNFLLEIDRLSREYMNDAGLSSAEVVRILDEKMQGFKYDFALSKIFFEKNSLENKLAAADVDRVKLTAMWDAYFKAISILAPDVIDLNAVEAKSAVNREGSVEVNSMEFWHYVQVDALLNSKSVLDLLPNKSDALRLRQINSFIADAEGMRKKPYSFDVYFNSYYFSTTQNTALDIWMSKIKSSRMQSDVETLRERLKIAANPKLSGSCDGFDLDVDSLVASGGDWTKVKTKNGKKVDPKDLTNMGGLVYDYVWGCHVEKDFKKARVIMEQWADAHGDRGRIADFTHCTMALWSRYGVGGKRDANAANRWEARALADTGVSCQKSSLVDPRDPWKDLK